MASQLSSIRQLKERNLELAVIWNNWPRTLEIALILQGNSSWLNLDMPTMVSNVGVSIEEFLLKKARGKIRRAAPKRRKDLDL